MDMLKKGWHPAGDRQIHRATWKKDIRNMGSKKDEGAERAKDHVSAPLTSLKDPESFGPPPKHNAYYPGADSPTALTQRTGSPARGLGSPVPTVPARARKQEEQEEAPPAGPYRVNTTGLRTDNLPKPPGRRDGPATPSSASSATSRPVPSLPLRTNTGAPPPILPPRQSETPHEYTPQPPPPYHEEARTSQDPAVLNVSALKRLGQSGVSVPGFGIGGSTSTPQSPAGQGHPSQLNELQQRFARMNGGTATADTQSAPKLPSWKQAQTAIASSPVSPAAGLQAISSIGGQQKKPPPPPPPAKRANLTATGPGEPVASTPPPIPMSSKPRPG